MVKKTIYIFVIIMAALLPCHAQTAQEADSLHQLGRIYMSEGNYLEGRKYTKQAMDIRKKLFGEVNEDYITSLNNYALSYSFGEDKDIDQAIKLQLKVMQLCNKLKTPHPQFALYALNMGRLYFFKEDYVNAAKYWEQSLAAAEKFGEMYEQLLEWLGLVYDYTNDKPNQARIMALVNEHNLHELQKPCEEVKCMQERAKYYGSIGDNASAKEWFRKALAIASGEEKAVALKEYATFLAMNANEYAEAAEYMQSAARMRKELSGEVEEYYSLMEKAGIYAYIGQQYEQSVTCHEIAASHYRQQNTPEAKKLYAESMKGLGYAYSALKNYEKAKDCHKQVVEYYEKYDKDNKEYPKAILNMAKAEKFNGEFDASIAHHLQAIEMFEDRGMESEYADAVTSLNLCYKYAGIDEQYVVDNENHKAKRNAQLDTIIKEEVENLELTRQYLGKLVYARSLATIGGCYSLKEDYPQAIHYFKQYMTSIREAIRDAFRLQNETERMLVWQNENNNILAIKDLLFALPAEHTGLLNDLTALEYDVALLTKGILLNSSIEFENVLRAKGDEKMLAKYYESRRIENEITQLRMTAQTDKDMERILALTQESQTILLQLQKGCADMADFTNYISYDWKDVQKALTNKDVAVEFMVFGDSPFPSNNYMVALVLTRDLPAPVPVPVCNLAMVKAMETFEPLFEQDSLIWGLLSEYLAGKERIFFSADGGFNRIGIEYLMYNGKPLSEQFQVFRLSSTKELCHKRTSAPLDRIVLFGDIDYNEESVSAPAVQQDLQAMRASSDGIFVNLENTLREVNGIQAILSKKKPAQLLKLTGSEASQSAFMSLNESKVNLIHIATHGAYNAPEKATDAESMQYSLLAFAGANLYEDTHDGIVTAAEIAKMNLRQCELAVLSACETGLGKLGDDGVFGLQRGFKNAGVHTLLMSLKEVHDQATADLMVSFYTHLSEGMTKREALIRAQQDIRAKGHKESKYWAAFILLDALD